MIHATLCRVDPTRNLLYVTGSVPGPQGCFMMVRDARRCRAAELASLPFPTCLSPREEMPVMQAKPKKNKYDEYKI